MSSDDTTKIRGKKIGILIGGSGLIGGYIMHYFKTNAPDEVDIRAPNSKKLSIREPEDIGRYSKTIYLKLGVLFRLIRLSG